MLKKLLDNYWFRIAALVFAFGVGYERVNSDGALARSLAPRVADLELTRKETAHILNEAVKTLDRVNADLQAHKLIDVADTQRINQALAEIERLRDGR